MIPLEDWPAVWSVDDDDPIALGRRPVTFASPAWEGPEPTAPDPVLRHL